MNKAFLIILDGWGHGQDPAKSAVALADTPVMDNLYKTRPNSELITYGEEVGLPEGQMGNSEVGHLNIGAGRVVYQEFARINKFIREGKLSTHPVLTVALEKAAAKKSNIHIMGLMSEGGVHSHQEHLFELCRIIDPAKYGNVLVHAFLDGRDTDPRSGKAGLEKLQVICDTQKITLASVIGRYYAMDRDKRWERVRIAYDLLVHRKGSAYSNAAQAVEALYAESFTDEFMSPLYQLGTEHMGISDDDLIIFFNFRTDRLRELVYVLTQQDMPEFHMYKINTELLTFTRYDETFRNNLVLFEKEDISKTLGEVLAEKGLSQIRIAETEKYPHVTFFFSGGREIPFENERRILIPSPKVATYDLQPEMSALELRDAIIEEIAKDPADFICLNFANADMVGHTGVLEAAIKAVETVDSCMGAILEHAEKAGYNMLIIADHGNADYMINPDGSPNTAHSKNPVPCLLTGNKAEEYMLTNGKLADIAPTILELMGVQQPMEMTGKSLLRPKVS